MWMQRLFPVQTTIDRYGRKIPKHAHGTANLTHPTSSMQEITAALSSLYRKIGNPSLTIRRLTICANHVVPEAASSAENPQSAFAAESGVQLDMFSPDAPSNETPQDAESEKNIMQALLEPQTEIRKNAVVKGRDLEEGATAMQRNAQIGGHKA